MDKECLIFSVLGLESIFAPKSHGTRDQLKNNIKMLFPNYDLVESDVNDFYSMRSAFLHGKLNFRNYYLDCSDFSDYDKYEITAQKAACLAVATIQKLVINNAKSIKFLNKSDYIYL